MLPPLQIKPLSVFVPSTRACGIPWQQSPARRHMVEISQTKTSIECSLYPHPPPSHTQPAGKIIRLPASSLDTDMKRLRKIWVNCARLFFAALVVAHMNIHREQMRGMFLTGGREETTSIIHPKAAGIEDAEIVEFGHLTPPQCPFC